jgi:hypothetical protein
MAKIEIHQRIVKLKISVNQFDHSVAVTNVSSLFAKNLSSSATKFFFLSAQQTRFDTLCSMLWKKQRFNPFNR